MELPRAGSARVLRRRVALGLAVLLVSVGRARAHARPRAMVPGPGDMLDAAPEQVSIVFSEALETRLSAIEVHDADGKAFHDGAVFRGADAKELRVRLKPLPAGSYRVSWRATSVDTHRTEGSYGFMVHS